MVTAAQKLADFRRQEPIAAEVMIDLARTGRDPGLKALSAATGIAPADLRAHFAKDAVTKQPLAVQSPVVQKSTHGGAPAGSTVRQFTVPDDRARRAQDADALIDRAETPALRAEVVQVLTEVYPPHALKALKASGVSIQAYASRIERPSKRETAMTGENYAAMHARDMSAWANAGGHYRYKINEVTVRDVHKPSLRTSLTHELAHALDWAAYDGQQTRSERPDFQALFDGMTKAQKFPSDYAATSPSECFAEAATIYLTEHTSVDAVGRVVKRDREWLRRELPALHGFMQRFFDDELKQQTRVPGMGERAKYFAKDLDKLIADFKKPTQLGGKPDLAAALFVGTSALELAAMTGRVHYLLDAQAILKHAEGHPDAAAIRADVVAALNKSASRRVRQR